MVKHADIESLLVLKYKNRKLSKKIHSYFLDSHQQAGRFHRALLNQFLRTNQQSPDGELRRAIVGGGETDVELAAELYHVINLLEMYGMPNMSAERLKIDLNEAGPRTLPALPVRLAGTAKGESAKLGVSVHENMRVTSANAQGFLASTADKESELITANLMVWAAGVKAPDFIQQLALFETYCGDQIIVKPTLQSTVDEQIHVIGDCCACEQPSGSWVPLRAQSAHQMASLVYDNLVLTEKDKPLRLTSS